MMESNGLFPPGFRFHPTDQELIIHYLRKKITSSLTPSSSIIADIDLYKFNPWELPDMAFFGEEEWFFFTPRDRKYPNGLRPNRTAACGYWKATGTDKPILTANGSNCLGVKKALVFYIGRPPKGTKTNWVMQEYRLLDTNTDLHHKHKGTMRLDDWVLCRVKHKGSLPPENSRKALPSLSPQPETSSAFIKPPTQQELSDYQLMDYFLCSGSQSESNGESSELFRGDDFPVGDPHQPELVSSTLSSIKRKLSFGALDELMMLPPCKRMHQFAAGDLLSPTVSDSDDQGCLSRVLDMI